MKHTIRFVSLIVLDRLSFFVSKNRIVSRAHKVHYNIHIAPSRYIRRVVLSLKENIVLNLEGAL